jgi:aminomethyltransferase
MQAASQGAVGPYMGYFHSGFFNIGGQDVYVSRTGWTGELSCEIYTQGDSTDCPRLWDHLMANGTKHGMIFSDMQSMNIRRIEAGIFDSGSDFYSYMTPFEAGLGKFIDLEKSDFIGYSALQSADHEKRLYGLIYRQETPLRGAGVFEGQTRVGTVTTGAYSPYLDAGIGYVRFEKGAIWAGQVLSLQGGDGPDRGVGLKCEIIDPPFYDREKAILKRVPTFS